MGGRIVAGTIQLLMAVAGFGLVLYWIFNLFSQGINSDLMEDGETSGNSHSQLAWLGWGIFALSWILAWFTSISLVRNAPLDQPQDKPIPPIIEPPIIKP